MGGRLTALMMPPSTPEMPTASAPYSRSAAMISVLICPANSDAAALDHLGLDAELLGELGGLLAAAVDHDDVDPDLRDQRHLLAEGVERLFVVGDLAADLDHEGLVLEPVDERQRLAQEVEMFGVHTSSDRIAFWTWRRFSASS
jgi:hypothetical protein